MTKRLFKDSLTYGAADLITKGIAALLFPLFTHYLSVSDFGVLALITVISTMAMMLIEGGINNAVQLLYYEKRFAENKKLIVSSGIFFQAAWGIVVVLVFFLFSYLLKDILFAEYQIEWRWVLLALGITLPNLIIKYCLNIIRLHYKPVTFGLVSLFANLLWMFLAIYLMKNRDMGIDGYFIANLGFLLAAIPIAMFAIRSDLGGRVNKKIGWEILRLGLPFVFSNVAYWLFGSIDRWLLAIYANNAEVGLYSVAAKISLVVVMVNSAFAQAWSPILLKEVHADKDQAITVLKKVSKYYLALLSFVCIALTLFSKEILTVLTPPEYWEAYISVGLLAFAVFLSGTTQFTLMGISIAKRTGLINLSSWIAVIVNIISNIFLSKYFGATGAAGALILTYLVLTVSYNYFSHRVFGFSLSPAAFTVPVLLIIISNIYILVNNGFFSGVTDILLKCLLLLASALFYIKHLNLSRAQFSGLLPKTK